MDPRVATSLKRYQKTEALRSSFVAPTIRSNSSTTIISTERPLQPSKNRSHKNSSKASCWLSSLNSRQTSILQGSRHFHGAAFGVRKYSTEHGVAFPPASCPLSSE